MNLPFLPIRLRRYREGVDFVDFVDWVDKLGCQPNQLINQPKLTIFPFHFHYLPGF